MYYRTAANLLIGDRELPLEADLNADLIYDHEMVGNKVEVSPVANGTFQDLKGKTAIVTGVLTRLGKVVALRVMIGGKKFTGTLKDFYIDRKVLEDTQPQTAISMSIKECMNKYSYQRSYWLPLIDGIEAFCFELASCAPSCEISSHPAGFKVSIPEPQKQDVTHLIGTVLEHNNFYTLSTTIFPFRGNEKFTPRVEISDHWLRTFEYTLAICTILMRQKGFKWEKKIRLLKQRRDLTKKVLRPLVADILPKAINATEEITGTKKENIYIGGVSIGFSEVRLKPGTVGLNEPPTDRRPYTVISIGTSALDHDDPKYLQQVVLHECIHLCAANVKCKEPHNELFMKLSDKLGLQEKYRN